jgi:hypothetical protein
MNHAKRIASYAKTKINRDRQGSDGLSGPQRRRLRKNDNKAKGVIVAEATVPSAPSFDYPSVTQWVIKVEYVSGLTRTFKVKPGEDGLALLEKYRGKATVASAELTNEA